MKIIERLIDLFFPPRPTEMLIRGIVNLPKNEGNYEAIRFLARYDNKIVKATIRENKYFNNEKAATLLGNILQNYLASYKSPLVIIPIPLSKERLGMRGYNQVETIARATKITTLSNILERTKHTAPQTSLNRTERLKNMTDAFYCKNLDELKKLEYTTVILLDDVVTTGATLKAARASLVPHLHPTSKLICVAIAH